MLNILTYGLNVRKLVSTYIWRWSWQRMLPPLGKPPPRSARPSSAEKWQDNLIRMEGKWSELISYNDKKKEMDSGREENG